MTRHSTILTIAATGLACLVVAAYLQFGHIIGIAAAGGALLFMAIVIATNPPPSNRPGRDSW